RREGVFVPLGGTTWRGNPSRAIAPEPFPHALPALEVPPAFGVRAGFAVVAEALRRRSGHGFVVDLIGWGLTPAPCRGRASGGGFRGHVAGRGDETGCARDRVLAVVLHQERFGIHVQRPTQAADVSARVEVPSAGDEV